MTGNAIANVGLLGDSSLLKRIADAIADYTPLAIAGVFGGASLQGLAKLRAWPICDSKQTLLERCDLLIEETESRIRLLRTDDLSLCASDAEPGPNCATANAIGVPPPDIAALLRIARSVAEVCRIRHLSATVVRSPGGDAKKPSGYVDGLVPSVDDSRLEQDLMLEAADILPSVCIRSVTAPVTRSNLLMVKLSLRSAVALKEVLSAFSKTRRIAVGASHEGFRSTADVNELFRELPRPRGDQWELFVWRDSVSCQGDSLILTATFSADAITVPETLDAIWRMSTPLKEASEFHELTDRSLNLISGRLEPHCVK